MSELPKEPTNPELLDLEVSQISAFDKFYKAAFMKGEPDDWEGPLGQASTIALTLKDTNPFLLKRVGYLNALLELKECEVLEIETEETRESLKRAFFG